MKKFLIAGLSVLVLAWAVIGMACSGGDDGTGSGEKPETYAALPMISGHPTSADYLPGDTVKDLSVVATVSDGGTMSYQWYEVGSYANTNFDIKGSLGSLILGATRASYTPEAGAAGDEKFYYVVITNKRADRLDRVQTSHPARIRFLDAPTDVPTVNVNTTTTNDQYVRGFGGMSNAFWIGPEGVARYMELRDIDTMFHPETGLGFNMLRIKLWYQPLEEVLTDTAGTVQMGNQIYCEIVKRVNRYGGYVLASPWTPPPQWKVNESEAGVSPSYLLDRHYADYGQYLKNFAQDMANYGAPIYSVSLQNEFTYPADYEGCEWTSAQNVAFLTRVGNFLNGVPGYGGGKAIPQVKLMNAEPHQYVTSNDLVRDNATTNALVDIYAHHTYGNQNNAYRMVQADTDAMRKEVWFTEWNTNSGAGLEAQDYSWDFVWRFADSVDQNIRINGSNAFIWWYLKRYYCMIGDNAYGTVGGQPLPRGWVLSHWAKYATDTVRVAATITGHSGGGNTTDSQGTYNSTPNVRVSAYRKKAEPSTYWEQQVQKRENSVSVVIYDKRTTASAEGQNIRINLPEDFEATHAHAIISDGSGTLAEPKTWQVPALVVLAADGKTADFFLPANSIMSLKFYK
jgi:O-glycosyl hydrolase